MKKSSQDFKTSMRNKYLDWFALLLRGSAIECRTQTWTDCADRKNTQNKNDVQAIFRSEKLDCGFIRREIDHSNFIERSLSNIDIRTIDMNEVNPFHSKIPWDEVH